MLTLSVNTLPENCGSDANSRWTGAPSADRKRGKCVYCRNRNTPYFCQKCTKWLCLEHVQPLCANCVCQINNEISEIR
ncbi:unnamed protein product [Callosobruchus maculatus]|uniref:PiggyBac transposable element-derived protein 4 C-terminal zinc-ribbon domain-containing protein n=1 Tax=Callosobruchus maculatus TaxID=64391 RepID=A0A653BFT8_CALMS|nr:unnamed protein product [Callosobruchus maculatus]